MHPLDREAETLGQLREILTTFGPPITVRFVCKSLRAVRAVARILKENHPPNIPDKRKDVFQYGHVTIILESALQEPIAGATEAVVFAHDAAPTGNYSWNKHQNSRWNGWKQRAEQVNESSGWNQRI